MNIKNFKFKAKVNNLEKFETKLLAKNPVYIGTDYQKDTYFNVPIGRLKLREGNIENALIQYNRENSSSSKVSNVILYRHQPNEALKNILTIQFGIRAIVDKKRKIYFIDNVKFHFDEVDGLGFFIEVEAIDEQNHFTVEELKNQCDSYFSFFDLKHSDLMENSYSDMILEKG